MLSDITIGQYFPGESPVHKMDARVKIIMSFAYVALLFTCQNFFALAAAAVFAFLLYFIAHISIRLIFKSVKPILPLIIFTGLLNLFFIKGGEILFHRAFITIYEDGVKTSVFMMVRVIALIVGMSLLTYTTSPVMLTDAIESLLSPLKRLRFPVHELAMMMTIALRFIPTLIEETEKIMSAQKARGAQLDTGGIKAKAKALVPVLVPLFISAFKRANELATAMECRCYRGGTGRTRLKQPRVSGVDFLGAGVLLLVLGVIVALNILL